jgi:hypothetical protein
MVKIAKDFPGILENIGRNLGEEFAFAVGLSDEKMHFDPLEQTGLTKHTEFKMPEFSPETKGVLSDIGGALEEAKRQRKAARRGVGGEAPELKLPQLEEFSPESISNALANTTVKADPQSFAGVMQKGSAEAFSLAVRASTGKDSPVKEQKKTNGILRGMAKVMERQQDRKIKLAEQGAV